MRALGIPIENGGEVALSRITLGTNYLGTSIPRDTSFKMMDLYFERGGRTFDCAHRYGQTEDCGVSEAERTLGDWVESRGVRGEVTLVTKGGFPSFVDYPNRSRLSAADIRRDCADSLALLKTDVIDVYFLHRDDETIPVADIIDPLDELVKAGSIRVLGASNWRLERILEANEYARTHGKAPFAVSQIQWSLAPCTAASWGDDTLVFIDDELRRRYIEEQIPVMAYSSQARGLFSKYIAGGAEAIPPRTQMFFTPENIRKVEAVRVLCQRTGISPSAACLGYITSHELPAVANIGPTSLEQLADSLTAADLVLSADDIRFLENA